MALEQSPGSAPDEAAMLMNAQRAEALAERLHRGQRHRDGTPLIDHVRRVAAAVPPNACVVAWLHEALEHTAISEATLLADGLSPEDLRAIRLLTRPDSRSDAIYLAHVELIARAGGPGAATARIVKHADLVDRALHASPSNNGWSPPYEAGLELLHGRGLHRRELREFMRSV